ncbi:ER membrane protein complex subunit 2 [Diutina catenulata]
MTTVQTKHRLLSVAQTGVYVDYTPEQTANALREVVPFVKNHADVLDNIELFELLELQFWLDIFASRDVDAKLVLDRMADQFDASTSQRLTLLQSVYAEAQGKPDEAQAILGKDADRLRLARRLCTFSREDPEAYIHALTTYLQTSPSDLVAWSELASTYHTVGHYDKAVFCYQEILLQEPQAYPFFYRVGLNYYYQFLQEKEKLKPAVAVQLLQDALNHFLRSVELFNDYDNGWDGVETLVSLKLDKKYANATGAAEYLASLDKLQGALEKRRK